MESAKKNRGKGTQSSQGVRVGVSGKPVDYAPKRLNLPPVGSRISSSPKPPPSMSSAISQKGSKSASSEPSGSKPSKVKFGKGVPYAPKLMDLPLDYRKPDTPKPTR